MIVPLLLAVDFMNFDYSRVPCAANVPAPALIRKGTYSYFDRKMGTGFDIHVEAVKRGSLRPGTQQAVVVLACDFPVGGTAQAYLYDIHRSGATLVAVSGGADWGGDWGAGPSAIHVRFANRLLYVDSCADDECALSVVRRYAFRGGKIQQVNMQTHKTRGSR